MTNKQRCRQYYLAHREERCAQAKLWRKENPEKVKANFLRWRNHNKEKYLALKKSIRQKLKTKVIGHYGGRCTCCGESELIFLCIDHEANNGAAHRRALGNKGRVFYQWLVDNRFPKGYGVLCFNCNFAKARGGCPHNLKGEVK